MGTFAIVTLILGLAGLAAGVGSSAAANETNKKLASEANETNKELAKDANATNISLANTAYQRSTASNQIAELRRAGFSDQQAKMLVSENFAPAAAPAATVSPAAVSPATVSPAFSPEMMSGLAEPLRLLMQDSASNPTGGLIGAALAEDVVSVIGENIHDVSPLDIATPSDFARFARSDNAPQWAKELVSSSSWKKMYKSILGQRAFIDWFNNNNALNDWKQNFEFGSIRNRIESVNERIAHLKEQRESIQLSGDELDNIIKENETIKQELQIDMDKELFNLRIDSERALLRKNLTIDELERKLWSNSQMQEAYIRRNIQNEQFQTAFLIYSQMTVQGKTQLLASNPTAQLALSVGGIMQDTGITDDLIYNTFFQSLSDDERQRLENDTSLSVEQHDSVDSAGKTYKICYWLKKALETGVTICNAVGSVKGLVSGQPRLAGTVTETLRSKGRSVTTTRNKYE